jgi:integrase
MARMYRIPKPEPRKNHILAVQIRVPTELQTLVGKTVLRQSTGTKDNRIYYQRAPGIVLMFEAVLQAARQRLNQKPVRTFVEIIPHFQKLLRMIPDLPLVECEDGRLGMWQWVEPKAASSEPKTDLIKLAGCSTATAMDLWKVKRGDNQPKQPSIDRRASKMAQFLAWAKKPDDLTLVKQADIQRYKEHLIQQCGPSSNVPRDHLIDICALFNVADENHKFDGLPGGNPAAKIAVPPKRTGLSRLAFTEPEAKLILLAAREHPEPIVRWGMWLACFLGTIIEEISDALVSHVVQKDGIWCLDITEKGRITIVDGVEQTGNLKTQFRPRLLPLHPALIREGFLDRVDHIRQNYGESAPLFPEIKPDKTGQRNTRASDIIMKFLRGIGIKNEVDPENGKVTALRDSYSWRHRFASQLEDMPRLKPDRQRFMTGHAAPDVHGKVYLKHPPAKLYPFIKKLCDPTIQSPKGAAA